MIFIWCNKGDRVDDGHDQHYRDRNTTRSAAPSRISNLKAGKRHHLGVRYWDREAGGSLIWIWIWIRRFRVSVSKFRDWVR